MMNTIGSSFTMPTAAVSASAPAVQFEGKAKKRVKREVKHQMRRFTPFRVLLDIRDMVKHRRFFR